MANIGVWNDILSASEASVMLGKNPKYIYFLWKRDSSILLEDSVKMIGYTLLITRDGYEYLDTLLKKERDHAIKHANNKFL